VHEFSVTPLFAAGLSAAQSAAAVTYLGGADATEPRTGSAPGVGVSVMSAARWHRATASFTEQWTRFFLLSSPTWLLPLVIWSSSRRAFREQLAAL
jgi:hypothetical protein